MKVSVSLFLGQEFYKCVMCLEKTHVLFIISLMGQIDVGFHLVHSYPLKWILFNLHKRPQKERE